MEDDKVEDFFSKVVEAPFAPVSRRIKEEQNRFANLTGDEAGAVCGFVASQAVRTLAHKVHRGTSWRCGRCEYVCQNNC
ncbi:MAG: hypothetical protein WB566_13160, partial [Terriglobales bacterium]